MFHIIEPFIDVAFHPWLKVILVAWLALPRFQGAYVIYNRLIVPSLDKYETKVDGHIEDMRNEAKQRAWRYILGKGWGAADRVLLVGKLATQGRLFSSSSSTLEGDNGNKEGEKLNSEASSNDKNVTKKKLTPLHSISFSETYAEDDEEYVTDFLDMLTRGLFVFALVVTNAEPNQLESDEFKLRVFALEEEQTAFLLTPLEETRDDEEIVVLVNNITEIIESENAQGITIQCKQDLEVHIVLPNVDDRNTLLNGLNICLPVLKS